MIPSPIFQNITDKDWNEMRQHALLRESSYEKNAVIFHTGQMTEEIGVVVNGCIHIENIDLLGNKSILSDISAGQIFAETYAFCEEPLMVDVVAAADSTILFLNVKKMLLPTLLEAWIQRFDRQQWLVLDEVGGIDILNE